MNITVVGTGYVGLVTGTCLANSGNDVTCLDIDSKKIELLETAKSPFFEPGLSELMTRSIEGGRLRFTSSPKDAYGNPDAIFICVGTPTKSNGQCDLSQIFEVASNIATQLNQNSTPLVVVKSTVPVGTTQKIGKMLPQQCIIANNPEFLREGNAIEDFMRPDRVVCGINHPEAKSILKQLYGPFVGQGRPLLFFDIKSSEMVKYASNAMLACKISFINEIASLCERNGANIEDVRTGMCTDKRIGTQFFKPGIGYGGSCFPKDTLAVMEMGQDADAPCLVNTAVHKINQRQRTWFADRIMKHFGNDLSNKTIAFWGLAFKPRTDDVRDAPSIDIAKALIDGGAKIIGYDPEAWQNFQSIMPEVEIAMDLYSAIDNANALVVCTEWAEFAAPDFHRIKELLKEPLIFDGRNIYEIDKMEAMGFTYYSVGRRTVSSKGSTATASQ